MTAEKLLACLGCTPANAEKWAQSITSSMDCWEINTTQRQAMFVAQLGHESNLLASLEENLNYGPIGLVETFGKYFTSDEAQTYARNPQRIANRAYGDRMGNGDENSGDGWRYRGRGLLQLTGRDSYDRAGRALRLDLIEHPELLLAPLPASMSAGWEWQKKGCNAIADLNDFQKVTKIINGGYNGLENRLELWARCKGALT